MTKELESFKKIETLTKSDEKPTFYFVKDDKFQTVWVSPYKADSSVVTDKVKALGDVYAHFGRFGEHSEYTAYMQQSQDQSDLKDFVFEVAFDIECVEEQSTYEDGYIYIYAKDKDEAHDKAKEYIFENIREDEDDLTTIQTIFATE